MPVINELIRSEEDGTISFGNYTLAAKSKVEDFEHDGLFKKCNNSIELINVKVILVNGDFNFNLLDFLKQFTGFFNV